MTANLLRRWRRSEPSAMKDGCFSETAYYSADLNPAGGDYIAMAAKDVETLRSICEERKGGMIHG